MRAPHGPRGGRGEGSGDPSPRGQPGMWSGRALAVRRGDPRRRRRALADSEQGDDWPARLSPRNKESVQRATGKPGWGKGCWPGTQLTGLKSNEVGAKAAAR
jgi:hypothetical protein